MKTRQIAVVCFVGIYCFVNCGGEFSDLGVESSDPVVELPRVELQAEFPRVELPRVELQAEFPRVEFPRKIDNQSAWIQKEVEIPIGAIFGILDVESSDPVVELPREIYIQSAWTQEEAEIFTRAIDTWQSTLGSLITDGEVMVYKGINDDDAFAMDDLDDGKITIYKVSEPNEITAKINEGKKPCEEVLGSVWTELNRTDVLIMTYKLAYGIKKADYEKCLEEPLYWDPTCETRLTDYQYFMEHFYFIVLHELGHVLGLSHNTEEGSVMFWSLQPSAQPWSITESDIENFCQLYDCQDCQQ